MPDGTGPRSLLCNPQNNKVYCANSGSDNVTIIDGPTDSVVRTIAVGRFPSAMCHNPPDNRVSVGTRHSSSITVLRDSLVGVEECSRPQAGGPKATVMRSLPFSLRTPGSLLLSCDGRVVVVPRTGAAGVRRLSPGVYFVRHVAQAQAQAQAVTKVVITH